MVEHTSYTQTCSHSVHFIKDAHIKMHWYNQDMYRM